MSSRNDMKSGAATPSFFSISSKAKYEVMMTVVTIKIMASTNAFEYYSSVRPQTIGLYTTNIIRPINHIGMSS